MLFQNDLAGVAKANDLCNRLGMDSISAGSTIAWAMEAYERGALTLADTGGIHLTWGNTQAILKVLEAMACNEDGLGHLLAGGSRNAAENIGQGSQEYAFNVKGLEMAMHNPRVFHGLAFTYTFVPQGGSHMEGGFIQRRPGVKLEKFVKDAIESIQKGSLINDGVFCYFTVSEAPWNFIADLLEAATGIPYTEKEVRQCMDRDYLLRYSFNLRQGNTPAGNVLPQRIVEQMQKEDERWIEDWPQVKPAYYRARGLDPDGYPTVETLQAAGLEQVLPDIALWLR
jgi:aldehyde:ferredoxin oxidoreductase